MKMILMMAMALLAIPAGLMQAATLDDAHAAFAAGKYGESTAGYQSVIATKGYSAPVLFDLGNSYFREGNYAEAILAYKRAQWLAPGDEDIKANLETAEKEAGVVVETRPGYGRITQVLSVNGWAWLGCEAWTLLCACLLLRAVYPARGTLLVMGAMVGAFALGDAIAAIAVSSGGMSSAVVVGKNPQALISPFPAAQTVFTPVPGETVRIEKAYDNYLLVVDGTGRAGWMMRDEIEPVVR